MSAQTPITVTEHLWIPLPDGRRLAARMWQPAGAGPFPVILEYLPYRKRDGTAPRDATTHPVFAAHGYACVRVDITGSGDSDGRFDDEYSEQELSDGEAVLEWIAQQPWSTGKVGMIGISWGGFNGLQMAYRRPEALKAVVSVASTVDRYADDIHYMGGCLLSDNKNWASQMFAYMTRPLDPKLRPDWRAEWLGRINDLPFMAADWLRHQTRDAFWKHGSVCEDWSAIQAPVLAITGWADAYVNAPPALAAKMTGAPAKALMGPWEHRYAHISQIEAADFHGEVLRWFDQYLKGEDAGAEAFADFQDGDILVCRMINPAWLPWVQRSGAVLSEVGGWLSHMAIVAREKDILMLVACKGLAQLPHGAQATAAEDGSIETPDQGLKVVSA